MKIYFKGLSTAIFFTFLLTSLLFISFAENVYAQNLDAADFETGYWTIVYQPAGTTVWPRYTGGYNNSGYCVRMAHTVNNANSMNSKDINYDFGASAGKVIHLGAMINARPTGGGAGGAHLVLQWYDINGNQITTSPPAPWPTTVNGNNQDYVQDTAGGWVKMDRYVRVPDRARSVRYHLQQSSFNGISRFDNTYFDIDNEAPFISGFSGYSPNSSQIVLNWSAFDPGSWGSYGNQRDSSGISYYNVFNYGAFIGTASGTSFTLSNLPAGYTGSFQVQAVDNSNNCSGLSSPVSLTTNSYPIAVLPSSFVGSEGAPLMFDASGSSDPYGQQLQYRWDFNGDGAWDTGYSTNPAASYTWNDDYSGTVRVEVSDGELTAIASASVNILNAAPTVNAGPDQESSEGSLISLTPAVFSDPGTNDTHVAVINWGDGFINPGVVTETNGSGQVNGSHIYLDNGIYTITLTVADNNGSATTDTLSVVVNDVSPTAVAGDDKTALWGDIVSFDGTYTDPGILDTQTAAWDFGDSSTAAGFSVSHIYSEPGTYAARLTVTDKDSRNGTDDATVTILKRPMALYYQGDLTEQYSDEAGLETRLTDQNTSAPISGKVIHFSLGAQDATAVTDTSGIAQTRLKIDEPAGTTTLQVVFDEDGKYTGSSDGQAFTVAKDNTQLQYTGDIVFRKNSEATLAAQLSELDSSIGDLSGKVIQFIISDGTSQQVETAITDVNGLAQVGAMPTLWSSAYDVAAVFAGDQYYFDSSTTVAASSDITPPTTTVETYPAVPDGDNSWHKTIPTITLTPDETASTYYSWDSTDSFTTYTVPFVAPLGTHSLSYHSIDIAGNIEDATPVVFKVDTAPPTNPTPSDPKKTSFSR